MGKKIVGDNGISFLRWCRGFREVEQRQNEGEGVCGILRVLGKREVMVKI